MANELFQMMGGGNLWIQNMIQEFQKFRQTFSGDPKAQVQALLNSGRMTQAQYNQLQMMARQLMGVLK